MAIASAESAAINDQQSMARERAKRAKELVEGIRLIAIRQMRVVRNLGPLVVSETDPFASELAYELEALALKEGKRLPVTKVSSEDHALDEASQQDSLAVAVLPIGTSGNAIRGARCTRLVNDLPVNIANPGLRFSLVASIENVLSEHRQEN